MNPNIQKLLSELEVFSNKSHGYFNVPADTGKFLHNLVIVSKAKNILEIGTSNGYSTLWLAEAAKQNKGKVTTIEILDFKVNMAKDNFKRAKLNNVQRLYERLLKLYAAQ